MFFKEQTADSVIEAVKEFEKLEFNKEEIREHALKFSEENFRKEIKNFVKQEYEKKRMGEI